MNYDFGSKKPLNWAPPKMDNVVEKATSHAERTEAYFRMGTPITRRGAYNGAMPPFAPNAFHPDLSPPLMLNVSKALGTMPVPLRPEDQGSAQPKVPGQPGVPGMSGMPTAGDVPPIGIAPNGMPIYADPFHPSHKDFGPADHAMAADQHMKMGDEMGANAHRMMGDDVQSPMDRFAAKFKDPAAQPPGMPAGGRTLMPGQPQPNPKMDGMPPARELPGMGPSGGMGPGGPKGPGPGGPPIGQAQGLMGPPPGPRSPAGGGPLTPGPQSPDGGAMGPVGGPPAPGAGPADIGSGDAKGDPFASLLAKLAPPGQSPDQGKPIVGNPTSDRQGPKPGMYQTPLPTPGSATTQQPIGTPGPRNMSAGPLAPASNAGFQGTYINPSVPRTPPGSMMGLPPGMQMPQQMPVDPQQQQPLALKSIENLFNLL